MDLSQLRANAKKALLNGKYKEALDLYVEMHKADPEDLRNYVKVANLREKVGDIRGAVRDYLIIANTYAEQGFVVQAISINKIVLRLDPTQTQVRDRLKELSSERGDDWAISTIATSDNIQPIDISSKDHAKLSFERTPLLSGLSGKELEEFMDSLQLQHVQADETIYRDGDYGDYLYLIGMGSARLQTRDIAGRLRVFQHLIEGDFFGEHAFMSRTKHSDEAIADSDCDLLKIDRVIFDAWVNKYPNIQSVVEEFYRQRVLARILAITPVFEGVPPEARMALSERFRLRHFDGGKLIVREGEKGDTFYLIRSGKVRVITSDMRDKSIQVDLGSIGEGNFFGEVALLTDKPRTASVFAEGPTELMELRRDDFNLIVEKYPSILKVVEAYQKKRVQSTIKTLMSRK